MHQESGGRGPLLVEVPSERDLSRVLRRWLVNAKIDRHDLHHAGPATKPIRFHDLRATGITWMGARGDDPIRIKQRAGHTSFSTTERYLRSLDSVGSFGTSFGSLPGTLDRQALDQLPVGSCK
jgi:integrase